MASEVVKLKVHYGTDVQGFYWPGSSAKRKELFGVKRNDPNAFESVYQGRPGRRIGSIFLARDFTYYDAPDDVFDGAASAAVRQLYTKAFQVVQCWDTAADDTTSSAYSVCITAMLMPCTDYHCGENATYIGPCEPHYDVYILDVYRRKMKWGDLLSEAKTQYHKWKPEVVLIENRSTGIALLQTLPASDIPVKGVNVGHIGKKDRAINKVDENTAASAQGWYQQHRVVSPRDAPWREVFEAELKDFTGENNQKSDQVDAVVHLVVHAIRLSGSSMLLPTGAAARDAKIERSPVDIMVDVTGDTRGAVLHMLGELEERAWDPYDGTCGRCQNYQKGYCKLQERRVIALDSCGDYEPARPETVLN